MSFVFLYEICPKPFFFCQQDSANYMVVKIGKCTEKRLGVHVKKIKCCRQQKLRVRYCCPILRKLERFDTFHLNYRI